MWNTTHTVFISCIQNNKNTIIFIRGHAYPHIRIGHNERDSVHPRSSGGDIDEGADGWGEREGQRPDLSDGVALYGKCNCIFI